MATLDLTLGYLAVDVATTTAAGQTSVAHKFYPFLRFNSDGTPYALTGRQQYDADTLRAAKLIDLVLPDGKQLEEIVDAGPVAVTLYNREAPEHNGGYSFFLNGPLSMTFKTRVTQQNVATPLVQTKTMTADVGGYPAPDLYPGNMPYASLHTALVTGTYLAEVLGVSDAVLTSKTITVTNNTTTGGGGGGGTGGGNDAVSENRTAGTTETPETITDMDGTAAINTSAPN